jgi:TonB-linked SusC/RagA family outer membrane protein
MNAPLTFFRKICLTATLLLSTLSLAAQNAPGTVSGTVSDSDGNPLAGVYIAPKGGAQGQITDPNGQYTITADSSTTLSFSFLGYLTQEVAVGNRSVIDIAMQTDTHNIDGVVVVGYGTMQKKQVTSAITSIGGKDLPIGVGGSSIATQLQGKVPGLVMSGTDSPNSGNALQLRGMASVNSTSQPLVVIDGMPGGDIRSVSPEEIQSIDVLKDGSASAIYGTRATGGVILITTKKGAAGKVQLSYTGELMLKQAFGAPDMLNATDYMNVKAGQKNDYGADTDWWDAALTPNPTSHRHVVTLQTGTENAKIFTSLMYDKNVGVLRGDSRKDYSGRVNADFKLFDGWLEIATHVTYRQARRNQNKPGIENLLRTNPTQPVYDANNITGWNIWVDDNTSYPDMNEVGEAALRLREGTDKWFRPDVMFKLNILPIRGLTYTHTLAYENRQWEYHEFDSKNTRSEQQQNRKGRAKLGFEKTELMNSDGYFSFIRDFGLHSINAVAGYSYFERNNDRFSATNYDFTNDRVEVWDLGEGSWLTSKDHNAAMDSYKGITARLMGYFARANYSFDDKYMATASIRVEGSSKFSASNSYGTFWGLSGGWRISRENFMQSATWIDDLKLRIAYGITGQEVDSANFAYRMFSKDTRWLMPDGKTWAYSYGPAHNISKDLSWEEKREWNIGLDFAMFNNRLYGSFDVYKRRLHDLLYSVEVPQPPYTESRMMVNVGTMSNTGWELVLGGDIIRSKNWKWSSNINLTHNKTILDQLWGENQYINGDGLLWVDWLHRVEPGSEVGSFHVYRHAGLGDDGTLQIYDKNGNVKPARNGTQDDRVYTHNYMPKVIAGWTHNVSYKNLSLDLTLTSWIDFDIYNAFEMYYGLKDVAQGNMTYDAINKNGDVKGSPAASTYFLSDGTFVKLQNLTLGYTIPMNKYTKHIQNIKVYFTGHNLFRITGYKGLNPEVNITGWQGGVERPQHDDATKGIYPQTRTYTFGVQMNF